MLDTVFMEILDMTKTASIVILFVILARLILKRAPKIFSYVLWAVVLFRLVCPVSVELPVSAVPELDSVSDSYSLHNEDISVVGASQAAYQAVGDVLNGGIDIQDVPTNRIDESGNTEYVKAYWWEVWVLFGQYVWVAGILAMAVYSIVSYIKLRKRLIGAVLLKENIYLSDNIDSPFVMGLFRPKIYLPSVLSKDEQEYIILHEKHHIKRLDHIFKAVSFVALCVHWFNPLVWLSFVLSGKDMEMSCDEAVIKKMGADIRADYSASLLSLATGKRIVAGTPLAFGEGDTKGRIRNLAKWKKPAVWIIIIALTVSTVTAVFLIADPVDETNGGKTYISVYEIDEPGFSMYDIIMGGGTLTVVKDADTYYNAFFANGLGEVRGLLHTVSLGKLDGGVVDHKAEIQSDVIIRIDDTVTIHFHDGYSKLYIQKGNGIYSITSDDYAVLNVGTVREFFQNEEYKKQAPVWEFNLTSSAWGHGEVCLYVDEKYDITGFEATSGVAQAFESEERNLKGISWRPDVTKEYPETAKITINTISENKKVDFDIDLTKVGVDNLSTFYLISAEDAVISGYGNNYEYVIGCPESETKEGLTITELDTGTFVTEALLTDVSSLRIIQNGNTLAETDNDDEIELIKSMLMQLRFDEGYYAHPSPETLNELTEYEIEIADSDSSQGDAIRFDKDCKQMWFVSASGGYTSTFEVLNGEIFKNYISQNVVFSSDLDAAVSNAIFSINGKYLWSGECFAEGHIIMGTDKDGDKVKAYVLEEFSSYGFDNGWFIEVGGHRTACVMTFLETDDGYVFQDVECTEDGSHLKDSVNRMFPLKYRKRAISISKDDAQSLNEQCRRYAEAYLKKLGRSEKIGSYGDVERVSLTDLGVSVEASNRILEQKGNISYCHIGYYEELQDGVRYLCRTGYSDTENIVVYIRERYDTGQITEITVFDSLTGEIISDEQPVNMRYFYGKILSVNQKGKYAVVEPLKNSRLSETAEKIYVSLNYDSKVKVPDLYEGLYVMVLYEGKASASDSKIITIEGTSAIYLYADMNYKGTPTLKKNTQEYTTKAVTV